MKWVKLAAILLLASLVVAGHVGLWLSDEWSREAKVRLTVLNAIGWSVVILPALGVARWASAHRGSEEGDAERRPRAQRQQDPKKFRRDDFLS
ncbi:hypothetical protein LX81_00036 [Palleronia aestuarii]|uniref:Phenylalanyl-tRNA synthetase subunit beta n=1 Tax=Palleronia aestuarii TaxID=568105 RepID=A0A2W7NI86_9RHOB|nr:hypothetical protein [Palleronia aestuarii]PZX19580.1 hypothetical protein LX81_00036 [Palleronia aestuarii]